MYNPNNGFNGVENGAQEHIDKDIDETLESDNLDSVAQLRALNEKVLHKGTGNLLRADNKISYELNLENMQKYLKDSGMNPDSAEMLLASSAFDIFGGNADYRLSLWDHKSEDGNQYIESTIRDEYGHRRQSGHAYKVFERNGLFAIYDSCTRTEERHYTIDEIPWDKEPSFSKYEVFSDQVTLIDPNTGKIVALGKYDDDRRLD